MTVIVRRPARPVTQVWSRRVAPAFAAVTVATVLVGCAPGEPRRGELSAPAGSRTAATASAASPATGSPTSTRRPTAGATATPSVAPQAPPPVILARTGGIAGVDDRLTVTPDGSWRYTTKGGASKTGTLTPAQRAELTRLTTDPALKREAQTVPGAGRCADAFTYMLLVGPITAGWVDCGYDLDGERPTVAAVVDLLTDATPF